MPVLLSMTIAVLIWGSYPYAAVVGLHSMTGIELFFFATLMASIFISIIAFFYFLRRGKISNLIENHKKLSSSTWCMIVANGFTHAICHGFFMIALTMSNKAGVSLIYEAWPVMALIMTPFFLQKKWKEVGLRDFIICLIALGGVVVIVLSNDQIETPFSKSQTISTETNYIELLGYVLALLGGYACALSVVLKGVIAERFRALNNDTGAIIISEVHSRVIAFIVMVVAFLLCSPFFTEPLVHIENIHWGSVLYIGFVVAILGGGFYTYALISTDNPTIHILNYFVPLIAVLILWVMGESTVNAGIWLGGSLIVVANMYLYFSGRSAKYSE